MRPRLTTVAALLTQVACADVDAQSEPKPDLETELRIAKENPDGHVAEVIARRYLDDPDITMTSYAATGSVYNCSGILIGPNIVLSAAHCGYYDQVFAFFGYRFQTPNGRRLQHVSCSPLYQTFSDTDMILMHCPSVGGVNPGDEFGYVDFDPRPVAVGDSVYSLWKNPVDELQPPSFEHLLYSEGEVMSTTANGWFVPDTHPGIGIFTDLYGALGASGSAQLSSDTHRILIGPVSTVLTAGGGLGRHALSMLDYLTVAEVTDPAYVNDPLVLGLGLDPADYLGVPDKDGDLLLDIQTDLERLTGEGARDHYALTFGSERKNALWQPWGPNAFVHFSPQTESVHLTPASGTEVVAFLRHAGLNLQPDTVYRISLEVDSDTSEAGGLEIGFEFPDEPLGWQSFETHAIDLDEAAGWTTHAFTLRTPPWASAAVVVRKRADAEVELRGLTVVAEGSSMDFELHDKRLDWRNANNENRAFVLPDGNGPDVDWAGAVVRTDVLAAGADWPLANRRLALVPNASYRVCFDHRKDSGNPGALVEGTFRVISGGSVVYEQPFDTENTAWQTLCTDDFVTPDSDNDVQFGIIATPPDQGFTTNARYLVDNLTIEVQ